MIDRRALIALTSTLPLAGRPFRLDLPDPRVDPLDTVGVQVLGISPDGTKLVCQREPDQLCFLDSRTGEVLIETEPLMEVAVLDQLTISWSPDGSHLAFSLRVGGSLQNSDIFIVNSSTGEINNLTAEGFETVVDSYRIDAEVYVDVYPVWADNDTVIFGRYQLPSRVDDDASASLMTLDVSSGDIDVWAEFEEEEIMYVAGEVRYLNDDRVVFLGVGLGQLREVVIAGDDGSIEFVDVGEVRYPALLATGGTHCLVSDVETYDTWLVPYDATEPMELLEDVLKIPSGTSLSAIPAFGPEPGTMVYAIRGNANQVYLWDGSRSQLLAELVGEASGLTCHWAADTVLISGTENSWVIPVK